MEVVPVAAAHVAAVHMEAAVVVGSSAAVQVVRVNQVQVQVEVGLVVRVRANQARTQARAAAGLVAQANQYPTPIRIHRARRSAGRTHRHRLTNTLRLVRHQTHIKQPARTLAVATTI